MSNYTFYPSGAVDLTLNIPTYFTFVSANVAPTSMAPGQLTWSFVGLPAFDQETIHAIFQVDLNVGLIGTTATITAQAQATASEQDLSNNSCVSAQVITAAFDPNDKQGRTSSGLSDDNYFLVEDEWIDYTIRFQNTGNAPATNVVLHDTLDTDLDIGTLEILGASHAFIPSFHFGRELIFTFDDINLPDSGSNFAGSQGFVSYRIKPNDDIIVGDVLENNAAIYFDINPPVITNTVSHVVDFSTRLSEQTPISMHLSPNPVSDVLNVFFPEGADRSVAVLTMDGRIVPVIAAPIMNGLRLDVHALPAGLYCIRTAVGTARFVKQ